MYSSSDFQKLWFLYKTEGVPKGVSIESFCQTNGIPYEPFSKWFGKYHRAVMPLHVDGMPQELLQSIGTQDSSQSLLEDYDNIQPDACNHWH